MVGGRGPPARPDRRATHPSARPRLPPSSRLGRKPGQGPRRHVVLSFALGVLQPRAVGAPAFRPPGCPGKRGEPVRLPPPLPGVRPRQRLATLGNTSGRSVTLVSW